MDDQWKKLSGAGNWDGLFNPLDKVLQKRLKLYGDSIQVIRDSVSRHDKRKPAHQEKDLFSKIKTQQFAGLYTVTDYLYARSDVPSLVNWIAKDKSAWIGYVAVATDEGKVELGRRDILICWRGTNSKTEGLKDLECSLISASDIFGETHNPHVHKGFLSLYTSPNIKPPSYDDSSAREQVWHAVKTLVSKVDYRDEEISITVTGHSLGAALATLSATDIVANKHNRLAGSDKIYMVTAFVFASPKVGDKGFGEVFHRLSELHPLHLLRIKNELDVVPKLPPFPPYEHVGIKLKIKSHKELLSKLKEGLHFHSVKQHLEGLGRTTRSMFHRGGVRLRFPLLFHQLALFTLCCTVLCCVVLLVLPLFPKSFINVLALAQIASDVPSLVNWIVKDKSTWIGYVAVATDEGKEVLGRRDIFICWRGTNSKTEWLKDCECSLISASDIFGKTHNPHLHKGFLSLYKSPNSEPASYNKWSARDQVLHAVKTLMNKVDYRDEEISITVTGHSLGAALATLSAADIVANKHNRCTGSRQNMHGHGLRVCKPQGWR
ncbi:hypothetical protein Patl1_11400 [Pistacia atlantica]|uniref:Uncharacterized protein n=1 Tax=Pistacia atlantica TaxID=434234 RepID=A0ACC1A523_9ROSI|nr:hypothetical protein Patl1_11400 [Pistacia atlantica]